MLKTYDQLRDDLRSDLGDALEGPDDAPDADSLWSESDLQRYINSAAERLAADTSQLVGEITLAVVAGEPWVRLPTGRIHEIREVTLNSTGWRLEEFSLDNATHQRTNDYGASVSAPAWRNDTGTPRRFTLDIIAERMRLYPTPVAADSLRVVASMMPPPLMPGAPIPFREAVDHYLLLLWAKHMAYAKQDADTLDLARSETFAATYRRDVVLRSAELRRRRTPPGVVRCNW